MREFYGQTTIHPVALAAVLVLGCAMLLLPRRNAVAPMILMGCLIAPAQRIVVFSLDFNLLRVMVVFGFVRLLLRQEGRGAAFRELDWCVFLWAVVNTAAYTALLGTPEALVNRLGFSFDALGMYCLFRCLIRSWDDVDRVVFAFILISIPVSMFFLVERCTGRNLFAMFGGVPTVTIVREGRLRCQGAFAHAILAGCFWASVLPLIGAWWWRGRGSRLLAITGVAACGVIIITCSSSTPVMAVLFGGLGWALFRWRWAMRFVRWSLLGLVILLHLVMNAPVWHLFARLNVIGGSTGWHRYHLIDQAIQHFSEWWLLGTTGTGRWGYGLQDVTNQYVLEGVRGGFLTLTLFVVMIAVAFRQVGRLVSTVARTEYQRKLAWALGVCLFVHTTSFMAVSYFGQIIMVWYMTLGMIGGLSLQPAPAAAKATPRSRAFSPMLARLAPGAS